MQERTNKRVQTITQNIDKVKGWNRVGGKC